MLIVSLVMLGVPVLLLGSLVLLVVCRGINDRCDALVLSDAAGASRSAWPQRSHHVHLPESEGEREWPSS